MAFRKRNIYLALDELGVVLGRLVGNVRKEERVERWKKLVLENPARVNFAVITDLSDWAGTISEDEVYSVAAWNRQVRVDNNLPLAEHRQLAWIGRAGAGLNQLTDMVNNMPGGQANYAATAQEAWQLVMPDVPMPAMAKNFFKKRTLL
jgi:hypothetical protein